LGGTQRRSAEGIGMDLKGWFRRPRTDVREELEAHLAMRAEYDASDTNAARKRFGNVLHTQEDMRRVWVPPLWDAFVQDARYTGRSWRRSPGFAAAAVLVLALGLGASTALFSALDRILFRGLPYPDADRLVSVGLTAPLDSNEFLLGSDRGGSRAAELRLGRAQPAARAGCPCARRTRLHGCRRRTQQSARRPHPVRTLATALRRRSKRGGTDAEPGWPAGADHRHTAARFRASDRIHSSERMLA
jgi:hypothetical protein